MKEVIDILCGECGGQCCRSFPVWIRDPESGRFFQNPTYYDRKTEKASMTASYRNSFDDLSCHYYTVGGCPPDQKPDLCKNWYCWIFDELVLGCIRPFIIGLESKRETRHILRYLIDNPT